MLEIYWAWEGKPPTQKQRQLFKHLVALCKENGLSTKTGMALMFRSDYWRAIDILKKRLKDAGVKWGEELENGER